MKLTGIAIGNGFCDPSNMLNYGDFFHNIGLLGTIQRDYFLQEQNKTLNFIQQRDFLRAYRTFDRLMFKGTEGTSTLEQFTGLKFLYNYVLSEEPKNLRYYNKFVQTSQTRGAIHVGNSVFQDGSVAEHHLKADFMKSVNYWITHLLDKKYKVLIYGGVLDLFVPPTAMTAFVNSIRWRGSERLNHAERFVWRNRRTGVPAGYVRTVDRFTEVFVRGAGQFVTYDKPENTYDMVERFIYDIPFDRFRFHGRPRYDDDDSDELPEELNVNYVPHTVYPPADLNVPRGQCPTERYPEDMGEDVVD